MNNNPPCPAFDIVPRFFVSLSFCVYAPTLPPLPLQSRRVRPLGPYFCKATEVCPRVFKNTLWLTEWLRGAFGEGIEYCKSHKSPNCCIVILPPETRIEINGAEQKKEGIRGYQRQMHKSMMMILYDCLMFSVLMIAFSDVYLVGADSN